jgi:hypothetical protein
MNKKLKLKINILLLNHLNFQIIMKIIVDLYQINIILNINMK